MATIRATESESDIGQPTSQQKVIDDNYSND